MLSDVLWEEQIARPPELVKKSLGGQFQSQCDPFAQFCLVIPAERILQSLTYSVSSECQ